jgi:serine/threonine protein kinase
MVRLRGEEGIKSSQSGPHRDPNAGDPVTAREPREDDDGGGRVVDTGLVPSPWVPGTHFSTYEIESRLAVGGMAEIWRAKMKGMEGFERRMVIKTMLTNLQHRPELVEMFISEASLAARLSHPNIVDVFDFGQLEGRYFIAMAFVPGVTLRFAHKRMVARGQRLPTVAVLHVMRDVCEALQYMHELEDGQGPLALIHRDLSPDNVILSTSGAAKLIDFGAARATTRTPPPRAFVGKYRYAAPERIRQEGEDGRSDVYSAGVILYEILTGVRPFEGRDADVIRAITSSRCCDPRSRLPDLPASVAELVCRATAQRPDDRFETARELGTALALCLWELRASSKERDVTTAISVALDDAPPPPAPTPAPVPVAAELEGVPEAIDAAVTAQMALEELDALCEVEILEASGPIRRMADGNDADTLRVQLRTPTGETSVRTPTGERFVRTPSGEMSVRTPSGGIPVRVPRGDSGNLSGAVPTVSIFDRGGSRRLVAPANLTAAAPAGANVLGWRTSPPAPTSEEESSIQRAVDLFDRGMELRTQGRYGEALDAWERALSLAPDNQVYQSNVRRLRDQLHALRDGGADLTPGPYRPDLDAG